ncbi:MAG TPA: GNAT family N-acetyltransferase [Bacteroidales bacterium]|nr:GNAT family N-acetyltransferase [Bacteroidales bacterium]
MEIRKLRDKSLIHSFLIANEDIQYYCIGDLDDFFWPRTTWYALTEKNTIRSIALLYSGSEIPTLLVFYKEDASDSKFLLENIKNELPEKFYSHLTPPLTNIFRKHEITNNWGLHYKMVLRADSKDVGYADYPNIRRLDISDIDEILELYSAAYPDNWFDKRMLETGKYFGYKIKGKLVGISGIHVYSPGYNVAALGNIAVHPDYRGRGIALKLTNKLCNDLRKDIKLIGLNVKADNDYAIRCYRKAGFEITGEYEECLVSRILE